MLCLNNYFLVEKLGPMIFEVNKIKIYFPYEGIYPEQLTYIEKMVTILQGAGHALIEMPCGTGKTIALLAATVSYQLQQKRQGHPFKIVYCSRTVGEIEKVLVELRALISYIKQHEILDYLGVGLSSRVRMCVNENATGSADVDLACRKMVRRLERMRCDFYENGTVALAPGIYGIEEVRALGLAQRLCPYFAVRESLAVADCVVYSYNYLVDPAIYPVVSAGFPTETVVIFDEAHNIDAYCIESLSVAINRNILEASSRMIDDLSKRLRAKVNELDANSAQPTITDCKLKATNALSDIASCSPFIPIVRSTTLITLDTPIESAIPYYALDGEFEAMPGDIRNSAHFLSILRRFVEFLKTRLRGTHLTTESIDGFVRGVHTLTFVRRRTLKFCSQRLAVLATTLEFEDDEFYKLRRVAELATHLGIYGKGFSVVFEPFDSISGGFNPVLKLCCLDAGIAIAHVFRRFRNVVITSGTLSPLEMYPTILNFIPGHCYEIGATLERNQISPLIVTKGNDQTFLWGGDLNDNSDIKNINSTDINSKNSTQENTITSSFSHRTDPSVIRNYGNLLISFSKTVPDNILCFFPSYIFMEEIVSAWSTTGVIEMLQNEKLVFCETPDATETELALKNYRSSCSSGRGAILLCVARGKVSEGIDFEHGFARAVIMLGVPFLYTQSVSLKERLHFLREEYGIREYDFLIFDALRHTAQCLGRVLRNKKDYGLMVMADSRFGTSSVYNKMPRWINERIETGNVGISIDMSISIAKSFFKEMAQPFHESTVTFTDCKKINEYLEKLANQNH